jgi:hypothetical protein
MLLRVGNKSTLDLANLHQQDIQLLHQSKEQGLLEILSV